MEDFVKQNGPIYIFRGRNESRETSLTRLFFEFPLGEIANKPDIFLESVSNVYFQEKHMNPIDDNPRLMDLSIMKNVAAADFHLKVHAITGLPEFGTSNTESIPYWDRQSVEFAFKHHFGEKHSLYMQESDVESVNALRIFLVILVPKYIYARRSKENLEMLINRKRNFTRTDISPLIERQLKAWTEIYSNYHRVLVAKIKHLVFCADKLDNWDIRMAILDEVERHISLSGLDSTELTIDLGVDGGVTQDTYRPAYQIKMLPQLKHLGVDEVSIPKDRVIVWPFKLQMQSLQRIAGTPSLLEEPKEYILDWRF